MKQFVQELLGKFGYAIRRTSMLQGGDPGSASRPIGQIKLFLEDVRARGFNPEVLLTWGQIEANGRDGTFSISQGVHPYD